MALTESQRAEAVTPRQGVSLHFFGDEGVLFDAPGQNLYAVNTAATFIWCCLEERRAPIEIGERLSKVFKFRRRDARAYVERIIARWEELGLIDGARGATESAVLDRSPLSPSPLRDPRAGAEGLPSGPGGRDYRILDLNLRLRLPPELSPRQPAPLLAPFALNGAQGTAAMHVDVRAGDRGCVLSLDGQEVDRCATLDQAVPMIKSSLLDLALRHSMDFAAVHAAAVGRGDRCVMLHGASGSGKSTLAAALVATGFRLLGDDTVVLAGDEPAARALPLAICVKEGAWKLLSGRYPTLMRQPVHHRADGKRVRYLPLTETSVYADPDARLRVEAIVFLCRKPGTAAALTPVPATDGLRRFLSGFHPLADGLDIPKVERLLRWIAGVDCFELRFSSIEDGTAQLRGMCP